MLPSGRILRCRTKEEIAEIVGCFRLSELSAAKFAAENGLNLAVLRRWLKAGGCWRNGSWGSGEPGADLSGSAADWGSSSGWSSELIALSGLGDPAFGFGFAPADTGSLAGGVPLMLWRSPNPQSGNIRNSYSGVARK